MTTTHNPWIKWAGGARPVPMDTRVDVKFRCWIINKADLAKNHYWGHDGDAFDIIEYRTITEQRRAFWRFGEHERKPGMPPAASYKTEQGLTNIKHLRKDFVKELRYIVIKIKEMDAAELTNEERQALGDILAKIAKKRHDLGKEPLGAVVIEKDWACYDDAWKLVMDEWGSKP